MAAGVVALRTGGFDFAAAAATGIDVMFSEVEHGGWFGVNGFRVVSPDVSGCGLGGDELWGQRS